MLVYCAVKFHLFFFGYSDKLRNFFTKTGISFQDQLTFEFVEALSFKIKSKTHNFSIGCNFVFPYITNI